MRPPRRRTIAGCLALAALSLPPAPSSARPAPAPASPTPRSTYPDGTGDSLVDRLNAAQLPGRYRGPLYYRGQPIPPAQPMDVQGLPPNVPQIVPPPPPGARAPEPSMRPPGPPVAPPPSTP
ncbi:hypothetical protein ACLRDC_02190 [Gluconacetobacter sacchari]|uniref:Uncharacterized protein n=2 Tax=Gluconacetobacter sacchari TaxID=92759 RepID=A0A7W4NKH9_9PROT|nr:hypothetical protein [Gluconacetobacter sacchari]MBB2159431.1 hypothetical protein [Gluconacetobacter sacchari]GBQ29576.1 hypothetical protein AA12717_3317 [Gluconacetobacter sacchari DSM 12717]